MVSGAGAVRLLLACTCCCLLRVCEPSAQGPAYCPSWNPLVLPCPLAENAVCTTTPWARDSVWHGSQWLGRGACALQVQALEANLDANLAGQTLARRTIEKALATNIERHSNFSKDAYIVNPYYASIGESLGESLWGRPGACKQPPRPLFMHFSGPTGVGKSLMAELIAKSLLSERDAAKKQLCGKLLLQMHQYSSRHPAHVEDHSLAIRKMVAEQL
jgi:hypothetical protein